MKTALVILVVLLAVIMPLSVLGAESTHYKFESLTVIELSSDHMSISGSGGGWIRQNLPATMRQMVVNTGLVRIAVSGPEFEMVTASQDRINRSGRYRTSSQELVPIGQMLAPTVQYQVSIATSVRQENQGAIASGLSSIFGGRNGRSSQTRIRALKSITSVTITLESIKISSGASSGLCYEVTGEASEYIDAGISGGGWNRLSGVNFGKRSSQDEQIRKAAQSAVRKLRDQLVASYEPEEICEGIDIASGRSVSKEGTVITFYRSDRPIASYEVLDNKGNTLFVRILSQVSLPRGGDPFKISQ